MMSALHLLWIIPLSAIFGMILTALMVANGRNDHEKD